MDSRRSSTSSVDTADLMDHRDVQRRGSVSKPPLYLSPPAKLSSATRGRAGSLVGNLLRRATQQQQHQDPERQQSSSSRYAPVSVSGWPRRRSSVSTVPLLGANRPPRSHQAITDALNGNDAFAIAVEEDQDYTSDDQTRGDALDTLDETLNFSDEDVNSEPSSRRSSNASLGDVWAPLEALDEGAIEHRAMWPDLDALNEFVEHELRQARSDWPDDINVFEEDINGTRTLSLQTETTAKLVDEPSASGGRLRPQRIRSWKKKGSRSNMFPGHDEATGLPFRFTYFRESMATIHSPTISGLLQPGQSFNDLFPQRPATPAFASTSTGPPPDESRPASRAPSVQAQQQASTPLGGSTTLGVPAETTPSTTPPSDEPSPFWLDIMNPTEEEMRAISKAFGIHPLTTEDIFLAEDREKVELFKNYYFICFRSFDTGAERVKQERRERIRKRAAGLVNSGPGSGTGTGSGSGPGTSASKTVYGDRRTVDADDRRRRRKSRRPGDLEPLNMYIIVFPEGVLTFHMVPTVHPINVRRRSRVLRGYLTVSSDWLSYALIDDITDGFAPMIEAIEDEVNDIEEAILRLHSNEDGTSDDEDDYEDGDEADVHFYEAKSVVSRKSASNVSSVSGTTRLWREKGNMLRRIGDCRKRVMSLLRLLGSKADVIKSFSKRCNEQWEIAPRSEIGMYLGDIQDHIVTMVQSLNHYEKLLARSHSNYLAQLNVDMTRVNNDMNDVLSRITVLGTIVLPMNIVTGLWGMNVWVPGQASQDKQNPAWFWSIAAGLFAFAFLCFYMARRIYKIA